MSRFQSVKRTGLRPAVSMARVLDEEIIFGRSRAGNPRQILRSRPSLRICHGLHPAPPPTSPAPPHTAAPLRAAALHSVARFARVVSMGRTFSDFRFARLSSIRFSTSPRHSRPVARSGDALGSAPPPGLAFSAPGKSLGLLRMAGAGAQTPRQRSCHGLRIAHDLPPTSLGLLYGVPRAERAVVASRWGARAPGPGRAARSLGRSRYALALLGQGRSAKSASLNGRRKGASAAAPALLPPSACGRFAHPAILAFSHALHLP